MTEKKKCVLVSLVLIIILSGTAFFLHFGIQGHFAASRMLKEAGLECYPGLRRISYTNWTDWLGYCSGYEISAFDVEGDRFVPPAGWEVSDLPVTLETLEPIYRIEIYDDPIAEITQGEANCIAWHFEDHRDMSVDFSQRDYLLAFCYRALDRDILFIYRGHTLYGSDGDPKADPAESR